MVQCPFAGEDRVHPLGIGVPSEDGLVRSQKSMSWLLRLLGDVCATLGNVRVAIMCTPRSYSQNCTGKSMVASSKCMKYKYRGMKIGEAEQCCVDEWLDLI